MMTTEQIKNIFTYHAPREGQAERYTLLRQYALELALRINDHCPESREKALAITSLQQTVMWANAAIAITEEPFRPANARRTQQ